MSNISVDSKELMEILDSTPSSQNVMLVGKHGIGKSEILSNYYSSKGMKVVPLFLGQMSDPGDLIGLPNKDEKTGKTEFMPPYWFPMDGHPVVLFLDELNRARPEVLQTIMDLALNRRLAGRPLPEGSRLISAVNDGAEYQLTDLDPALVSRFNIYTFRPGVDEWLLWASKNDVDSRVIEFISNNHEWLDNNAVDKNGDAISDTSLDKTPDRRGWKKVSDIIKGKNELSNVHKKLIAGVVGSTATSTFFTYMSENRILSAQDVLYHFDEASATLGRYEVHQLAVINDSIMRFLETKQYKQDDVALLKTSVLKYMDVLGNRKEAMGHFASLFEKGQYPSAIKFLMANTPEVYRKIMMFIAEI